jgi:hypothetical protein
MEQIQSSYATFEQAKKLKEKGFDEECTNYYTSIGKEYINGWGDSIEDPNGFSTNEHNPLFVFSYSDFNKKQKEEYFLAPEQHVVVEWLRINHGIEIVVIPDSSSQSRLILRKYTYSIFTPVNGANLHCQIGRDKNKNIVYFINPQEAYSAAFDYVLNNLI